MDSTTAMQNEEEYAVQEPAWTYYERLSLALGCDSGSVGISSDMTLPDWYSGCFVNDKDRLTINVIGDSLQLRQMLEDMLKGDDFDMGIGLYSRNEQRAVTDSLLKAVERDSLRMNMSCESNVDGTVDVTLEASGDSVIEAFRKDVFNENVQGRVVVQFLIDVTGNVDSVKVVKNKDADLDAEAVRIVRSFQKFTVGKFDSISINQWMTLPIMFKKTDYDNRKNTKYYCCPIKLFEAKQN